jgi:hypothetical protein
MPFSAVTTVRLQGTDDAQGQKLLNEVLIPRLKGMPGFQSARFLRSLDGATGVSAVIFDTESNAKAALDGMRTNRPAEAPPIENTAIWEVVREV